MSVTIPDSSWYRRKSSEANVPPLCPYANVHRCPRYYGSIDILGREGMITSISSDKKDELDILWERSGLRPVIAEDDTSMTIIDDKLSSIGNFCPEVSFKFFHYYASHMMKYLDGIDKGIGHRRAEEEKLENDWRYAWYNITACHYLECSIYDQVEEYNTKVIGKFDELAHPNVVSLIGRMERCLENDDPSGALHAAANIIETTAKDIIDSPNIQNQTLGSFLDKYKNESALPSELKEIVAKIYNLRSRMPLSGHGSTSSPDLNMHDAIIIAATVKFIVEIEYRMKKI